jgi:hypothetical protein
MNQHVAIVEQNHRPWQAVEYEIISRMAHAGKTDDEIAGLLGRHRQAVMNARKRMGIASKQTVSFWTEAEMARLEILFNNGLSDQEISARLGRSVDAVRGKRAALGLETIVAAPDRAEPVRRGVTAAELWELRPCPISADYETRARANAAYLIAGMRAGHPVYRLDALSEQGA